MPTTSPAAADFQAAANLPRLYELLDQAGMGAGWNKPEPALWPSPRPHFVPAHWSYAVARPALDAAGRHVSTELAERRNLILANPIPGNLYATVRTLLAAYQMVLPHETARSHRHTPNALRLVLDAAPGMYTVVDGVKIPMAPGDVLLTPNWAWHGHANESDACACWIDFLDVPAMHFLEAMFFEPHAEGIERGERVDPASPFRFAFEQVHADLERMPEAGPGRRVLPLGPPEMNTIGLQVERMEPGARHDAGRTTAHAIYAVMEGRGTSQVDDRQISWARGDVFAVPGWRALSHAAQERSWLLRVSDEPLMRRLGWLRREA